MNSKPKIAIIGITGFIGNGLPAELAKIGYSCTGIHRGFPKKIDSVDHWQHIDALDLTGYHAVINLAGKPIDKRWTTQQKIKFHSSRIGTTDRIIAKIRSLPADLRPKLLINASGIGIYGDRGDEILTERSSPASDYLAKLCLDWEHAANEATQYGTQVRIARIGIVLGLGGGAFQKMHPLFKLGLGGKLSSGQQWLPWIHLSDLRRALIHAITSPDLASPFNAVAPNPIRNREFTQTFGHILHRPTLFTAPRLALKAALGDFADALLASQRANPAALVNDGFEFEFPTLESALLDLTR